MARPPSATATTMATIQAQRLSRKWPLVTAATPEAPRMNPAVSPTRTIRKRKKRWPPKQSTTPTTSVSRPTKVSCTVVAAIVPAMAPLGAKARALLPDSAFAYIDSKGRRSLPINDEAHVRNALSRFNQMRFEDGEARERARTRLLRAAKKHGIVPIGFIAGQLRAQNEARNLPVGLVTFLLTDIEDSTRLLQLLGDGYAGVLTDARKLLRAAVLEAGGREVDTRADEYFAVFVEAPAALAAALAIQRKFLTRSWPEGHQVRVRVGLHAGRPT